MSRRWRVDGSPASRVQHVCAKLTLVAVLCVAPTACQGDAWNVSVPAADMETFREEAYPVLLRDCGFNACHGDARRFLLIYGPNRARLNPLTHHDEPAEPLEVEITYQRALSMLASDGAVTRSLLLTKPLEERVGGTSHGGVDDFDRNVYQSPHDPGYVALLRWAVAVKPSMADGTP